MASKRYQITLTPFIGLNGKLGQSKDKCEVLQNSNNSGVKFYFGSYKIQRNVEVFGLREKSRNLSKNPYSSTENNLHLYFKQVMVIVGYTLTNKHARSNAIMAYQVYCDGSISLKHFVYKHIWESGSYKEPYKEPRYVFG